MQIKRLLKEDDAVSPVIGVILMVAITVILAAVIASFVLGLGNDATSSQPTASFGFDYDGDTDSVTITHESGDTIAAEELYVRGTEFGGSADDVDMDGPGQWIDSDGDGAGENYKQGSEISSGKRVEVGATSSYDFDIVWEPVDGGNSATLSESSGPDA